MGGNLSANGYVYTKAIAEPTSSDVTAVYREINHPELMNNFIDSPCKNCWDLFLRGHQYGPNRPCLGTRRKNEDGTLGDYEWISYDEVKELALQVGAGLFALNGVEKIVFEDEQIRPYFRVLGVYSKNRFEWTIVEQACSATNVSLVPFFDSLGADSTEYILDKTCMTTLVASDECAQKMLLAFENFKYLKNLILMDKNDEIAELAKQKRLNCIFWDDLVKLGREKPLDLSSIEQADLNSINTICFTSGTTGVPKGALLSHGNLVATVAATLRSTSIAHELLLTKEDVMLSYLPLAHIYERSLEMILYAAGARVGFYCGDILKIVDDLKSLKPTVFISVPRLYCRINDRIFSNLSKKSYIAQSLFKYALKAKVANITTGRGFTHSIWDPVLFKKTKDLFGGRVRFMLNGAAPLPNSVQNNLSAMFCCPLVEGYGMTETMGASFVCHVLEEMRGVIGGPVPSLEFRLASIPDMNYDVNKKPSRGEVQIRGYGVCLGYFRNPTETQNVFTSDGWLKTGDIAELVETGCLKIIDRKKSLFKLSQGEYVIPEKIEGVLSQVSLTEQVYVTGLNSENCTVGVVVPSEERAKDWASKNSIKFESVADIYKLQQFKTAILEEIETISRKNGLLGYEIVRNVHIHPEAFTVESKIITPTFKYRRANADIVFKAEIEKLYKEIRQKAVYKEV